MERQLANLTGLVQKALTHAPHTSSSPREYLQVPPGRDSYGRTAGTCRIKNDFLLDFFCTFHFIFIINIIFLNSSNNDIIKRDFSLKQ